MTPLPGKRGDRFVIDDPHASRAAREDAVARLFADLPPSPSALSSREFILSGTALSSGSTAMRILALGSPSGSMGGAR